MAEPPGPTLFDNLHPGYREIRVLELLPGAQNDSIRCTMRIISLDSDDQYEALSYVWGERNEEEKITLVDYHVNITRNLHAALRRLRLPRESRTLWADQLCINQADNQDRATQVALMRDIYRRCSRCVIWLGEMRTDRTFNIHDARDVLRFIEYTADLDSSSTRHLPTLVHDSLRGERTRKAFEAFSMYGNLWWSRIWTIQEAIVPSKGIFIWGELSIDRALVFRASKNLRSSETSDVFSLEFRLLRLKYTPLLRRLLYPVHGFRHAEQDDGALDLLMRWRHRDATDTRDKVYGLGGLLDVGAIPSVKQCSYDIPVPDLFQNVTIRPDINPASLQAGLEAGRQDHSIHPAKPHTKSQSSQLSSSSWLDSAWVLDSV